MSRKLLRANTLIFGTLVTAARHAVIHREIQRMVNLAEGWGEQGLRAELLAVLGLGAGYFCGKVL